MASVFVRYRVTDFARWKERFDAAEPNRRALGMTAHSVHRDADDPNVVIVAGRVPDLAPAREFLASPEFRSIMEQGGVVGPPEIWFAEDVEDKRY